jgi:hypothetical protein
MCEAHAREPRGGIRHDRPPQLRRLEHVGLVHRRDQAAALPGQAEGHVGDPADFLPGVPQGVDGLAGLHVQRPRLAEVEPTRQLPDEAEIGAGHPPGLEGAGVLEPRPQLRRPQVREDAKRLSKRKQRVLRPLLAGRDVIGGVAHGPQQHRVGGQAGVEGGLGQGRPGLADRRPADRRVRERETVPVPKRDSLQHAERRLDDLRADPVPRQHDDPLRYTHASPQDPGRRFPIPLTT